MKTIMIIWSIWVIFVCVALCVFNYNFQSIDTRLNKIELQMKGNKQ